MKRFAIFLIIPALFLSCSKTINSAAAAEEEIFICGGRVVDLSVLVAIVDEEYNDLLNPQLPNYLGDEYTSGIEIFYLVNGKKISMLEYYRELYRGRGTEQFNYFGALDNLKVISPPYRYAPGYGNVVIGTLGKYFMNCTHDGLGVLGVSLSDPKVTHTYIRYPDGSDDEIKVEIYENSNGVSSLRIKGKVWVNGELAFDLKSRYYNPKYFPFLKPVLDDVGKQIEDWVMPETAEFLVWLVKSN